MPLSEFLRLAVEKLEASKKKSACSNNLPSRTTENEVVELVWEDGQVMMQGQSSKITRTPTRSPLENLSNGKFGRVDSLLNDISAGMPSEQMDLSQNDEMVPWLSYPVNDGLQDYCSEMLPEISNVAANGISARNGFLSGENGNMSDQAVSSLDNGRDYFKFSSSKTRPLYPWLPHQGQTSDTSLGSGVSNILSNSASNCQDTMYGSFAQDRDPVNDHSASKKMERQNIALPSKSSNLLNFSNFSRPPSVSSRVERVEVKSMFTEQLNNTQKEIDSHVPSAPTVVHSRQLVAKERNETFVSVTTENFRQETSMKNDKALVQSSTAYSSKRVQDGERTVEPMVASSSVGSGSSAERVSYEQTHNSKRKSRDIEDSECHSDDIGTELIGVKKATPARGGTASKRSRAAEVHNLSERRRRDRINDKMRALQELIPNCNKADKASMLDEAIEYLKNLQHQLQVMSMRAGLYMPHMILPRGAQHIYPAHLPHFSPMGFGNGVSPQCPIFPLPPMQGAHFPPVGPNSFPRGFGPNIPLYGHPSQGHHVSVPRTPLVPLTRRSQATSAVGSSDLRVSRNDKASCTSPKSNSENPVTDKNSEYMRNAKAGSLINRRSNQLKSRNEVVHPSVKVPENKDEATDIL